MKRIFISVFCLIAGISLRADAADPFTYRSVVIPSGLESSAKSDLLGTEWLVEDINGHGVIDYAQTTLALDEDAHVTGSTGCNKYSGSATIDGDRISFGPMAMTRKACPEAVMDQEQKFLQAMHAVRSYAFQHDGQILHLRDEYGDSVLRLSIVQP